MLRIVLAIVLCLAGSAEAAELDGTRFPDAFPVDGQQLQLNGLGLRTLTIFRVHAYIAGLYLPRISHDERQIMASPGPKVLLLRFLHSGSKAQVEDQFRHGETVNCGDGSCNRDDAADYDRMIAAAPAVNVGDTFTFVLNDQGVRFYVNNRLLAQSAKPDLGRLILLGFIGDHPPSQDLRLHLLGATG